MIKPFIIIITGLPGTGKTTLGKKLSEKLSLPFITRDALKELLFDTLGWSDREWSKKLGIASYALMDYFIKTELKAGRSFIIESNFKPEFDNAKFKKWQNEYHYSAVQILCYARGEVLFNRFKQRAESGERHPGHVDSLNSNLLKDSLLAGKSDPLNIEGKVIKIDTTDFNKVDVEKIISLIEDYI
jgi:predicted kinase